MKNIKSSLLVLFLIAFSATAFATDYYSIRSGSAADVNTWNTSRDGNGTTPAGFTDPNDNFIIQNQSIVTGAANFSCAGSMIIETGGVYNTGRSGNQTQVATLLTINNGGILKLADNTTLFTGFILIQGTLENLGGELKFSTPALAQRKP